MSQYIHPRIGVGVFVLRSSSVTNPEFIMGKRQGSVGSDTWALPGGHLEFGESFEECARREVLEETGLKIKNLQFLTATNDVMQSENKHYVTIFMTCEREGDQEPVLLEPEKCYGWKWVSWTEMKGWAECSGSLQNEKIGLELVEGIQSTHHLFTPMIALLQQRPGVAPSIQ